MNCNVLPKEESEVVLKVKDGGHIFSSLFQGGIFYCIIGDDKTASYQLKDLECWHYSEDLFNGAKTQQPIPNLDASMWEQRRYEIAKDVLAGFISKEGFYLASHDAATEQGVKYECDRAIQYTDTLIEMLKNTGE